MVIIAFTFMRHVDLRKNVQNLTVHMPIQEKVIFLLISGPSNPLEAFMKNMMMSKNPNMMFKNKNKKRPTQHDAKEDDGQDQQQ